MSKANKQTNVTMLQSELRNNASKLAEATGSVYGHTIKQAELLNEYFNVTFAEARWFEADTKAKTPLNDEIRLQREIVVNAMTEKGHSNGRVTWQRIRENAWKLAFPKEAEAEKVAKEQAKAKQAEAKEAGEVTTIDITEAMMDSARFLAGECDWDKSLANKVLALVFAEATKQDKKAA